MKLSIGMALPVLLATVALASAKDCILSQQQMDTNANPAEKTQSITCVYACVDSKPTRTIKPPEKCPATIPEPAPTSTDIKGGGTAVKPK